MERKEAIRGAYRMTGGNNFYDGMITCSMRPWSCSTQGWCGRLPAWTAADATIPSAATKTHT